MSPPQVGPILHASGHSAAGRHGAGRSPGLRSGFGAAVEAPADGWRLWPLAKRAFDLTFATVLLVATLPILLLVALAIKVDSPGPVFFRVRRVGYRGRPLMMLKFRKMCDGARGCPLTTTGDARLTRIGAVLTQTRLDELPQLWDVLRGRMSLIGPRPEDPRFVKLHSDRYERILSVRPGITGITQLAFAAENRVLDRSDPVADYVTRLLPQKVALDSLYVERYRPSLDLAVVRWTLASLLLRREVAVNRLTGRMTRRWPRTNVVAVAAATAEQAGVAAVASNGSSGAGLAF